jgi:hypothetical protein
MKAQVPMQSIATSETIFDAAGQALGPDAATFVKSLDRLLTVGTYYALEHEQYHRASETACAGIVAAIGTRPALAIEIAAAGLVIDGQTLDPRLRVVRQLHELLVALNVARLEFSARLNAADLRQALAALNDHRLATSQAHSFREVTISNLPPTVSVASRRVGVGEDASNAAFDGVLEAWRESSQASEAGETAADPSAIIHEFTSLLRQAIEAQGNDAGHMGGPSGNARGLCRAELEAMQVALRGLLERDRDASDITELMKLARQAIGVSGDAKRARVIFDELRRRIGADSVEPTPGSSLAPIEEDLELGVDELALRVVELASRPESVPDPGRESRRDQFAICLAMMATGPRAPHDEPLLDYLRRACASPDLRPDEMAALGELLTDFAQVAGTATADRAAAAILGAARAENPSLVSAVWSGVDDSWPPARRDFLWPHLVNDLLLGLPGAPEPLVARLWQLAASLEVADALGRLDRLSPLPGALNPVAAEQVFLVAPSRVRSIHAVLLHLAGSEHHGPRLYRALLKRPPDRLTGIVMGAVRGYEPDDRHLYITLLSEGGRPQPSRELKQLVVPLLLGMVDTLPEGRRTEHWVPGAIAWLAATAPIAAAPLLQRILNERRLLTKRVWPEACRIAAQPPSGQGN